jgi:glucokinase
MTQNPGAKARSGTFIGVDLGGTHVRAACVDGGGHVLGADRRMTSQDGPEAVSRQIEDLIATLRHADTLAMGVGVPGTIDAASGKILNIPALDGWAGFALVERLSAASGLPCMLENDAKAAAMGEWWVGAGRGCANVAYVTVGTGIGGAMIVDGRLIRGAGGLAGEVGHTHVTDSPEQCACGRYGCWQAVASGTALGNRARAALAARPDSRIGALAAGASVTAFHVAQAAIEGDDLARDLLDEFARYLGMGLANVQHCYSPSRIIIGGGISALFDLLKTEMEAALLAGLLPGFAPAEVRPAELGNDAGLVGAALISAMTLETD